MRASNGKKTISTVVSAREVTRFQMVREGDSEFCRSISGSSLARNPKNHKMKEFYNVNLQKKHFTKKCNNYSCRVALPQKQRKQGITHTAMHSQTTYMYTSQPNALQSSYKSQCCAFTETILGNWRCRKDGLHKRTALYDFFRALHMEYYSTIPVF